MTLWSSTAEFRSVRQRRDALLLHLHAIKLAIKSAYMQERKLLHIKSVLYRAEFERDNPRSSVISFLLTECLSFHKNAHNVHKTLICTMGPCIIYTYQSVVYRPFCILITLKYR